MAKKKEVVEEKKEVVVEENANVIQAEIKDEIAIPKQVIEEE